MDIRCRKLNCKYNDRFTCRAKELLVKENGDCGVYEKTEKVVHDISKSIFTKVHKYAPQRDVKRFKIECNAPCVLKKEGRCIANGITINDWKEKPVCMTIVKK